MLIFIDISEVQNMSTAALENRQMIKPVVIRMFYISDILVFDHLEPALFCTLVKVENYEQYTKSSSY